MDRDDLVTLIEDHIPIYKLRAESEQTSKFFSPCFLFIREQFVFKFANQRAPSKLIATHGLQ